MRGVDRYGHFELEPEPTRDFDPAAVALHRKADDVHRQVYYQGAAPAGGRQTTTSCGTLNAFALPSGSYRFFLAELCAMQDAPMHAGMRLAIMHRAAVVPQHDVANGPVMGPGEIVMRDMIPKKIEQFFTLFPAPAYDVLRGKVATPTEVESFLACNGM